MQKEYALLAMAVVALFGSEKAVAQVQSPVKLSQAIDFLDNCYFTKNPAGYYTQEELRTHVRQACDHGFRKIYFRGTGGCAYYDSKVRHKFVGESRRAWAAKLRKTIETYDVVAEYIKVCHELGMELYYWDPIFDNYPSFGLNYPGMADYEDLGPAPFCEDKLNPEHYAAHRKAYLPREDLPRPIARLRLRFYGTAVPTNLTSRSILVYTAPHGCPFARYEKPFDVAIERDEKGAVLVLSGLEIANPVIKLSSDEVTVTTDIRTSDCVRAFYADGAEVELFKSAERFIWPERDRLHELWGQGGGMRAQWGNCESRAFIVRFGDFGRYAMGRPEFAYPECRKRLVDIVTELYERYPDLDGVTFSIRSHTVPACGFKEQLGYGEFFYGFSEPIAREYERRYGVDPRKSPYDEKKLLKLRGEYLTQVLDEVGAVVHAKGGKLEMMAPVNPSVYEGLIHPVHIGSSMGGMYPWWVRTGIDDFFDIATWAKRGSVDLVLMLGTGYRQAGWNRAWTDEIRRFRSRLAGTKTRLGIHYLLNDASESEMMNTLPGLFAEQGLDEVEYYEQYQMYAHAPYMYPATEKALRASGRAAVREVESEGNDKE